MAEIIGIPDVKYTPKDFENLREELITVIKNRFPGIVTDFSSQNVMTVIVELMSYVGDQLAFYQDAQAREAFFPTAKLRSSLLKHSKLIGFSPQGRVAATINLRIELLVDSAFPTIIPFGSVFTTPDRQPVQFRTLADVTVPAGPAGTFVETFVENSSFFGDSFVAEGAPLETFTVNFSPVLLTGILADGTPDPDVFRVFVDNIPYTIVDSFVNSGPTDTHVTVELDNLNRAIVQFGDGISGVAASGQVQIQGRVGGGSDGNNARISQGPSFLNTNNDPVQLAYSNSILSSGGADEQTIESIRIQAPLSLQSSNRTVSIQDFIINSEGVSGVDRALPLTSNEDPIIEENKTEVIIITDSPTNAQLIGGNAAIFSMTAGVDDDVGISIDGETPQYFSLGSWSSGEEIAAALQFQVRSATPEFPLDHAESYTNFQVDYDTVNQRYILTTGQAGLDASIEIFPGPNDATVPMKLDSLSGAESQDGSEPSAATKAAVLFELTVAKPVCITHVVEIFGPDAVTFNLDMRIRFGSTIGSAAARASVRDSIRANYEDFFAPRLPSGIANPEINFGQTMRFSDLICVANDTPGVESVDEDTFLINGVGDDAILLLRQFPVLGGITIRDESGNIV